MMDCNNVKKIWVVRHGMRMDFVDNEWVLSAEKPYNPPLAPVGLIQAEETAERLKLEDIDHIFASPFLRTLQTANALAEKKGEMINVEAGLSEWLKTREFSQMPDFYNTEDLKKQFPLINTDYKSIIYPEYPENQESLDSRTEKTLESITGKYSGSILIISHGSPIKSIFKTLTGAVPDEFQPMCSVTCFDFRNGVWEPVINGDSSHLTNPDTTRRAFYSDRAAK